MAQAGKSFNTSLDYNVSLEVKEIWEEQGYFIQFQDEELEDIGKRESDFSVNVEQSLAYDFARTLDLKKKIDDDNGLLLLAFDNEDQEIIEFGGVLKKQRKWNSDSEKHQENVNMAEEAGLIMVHPQP